MSNENRKVCTTLNYIVHFLTLVFAVTLCIPISPFTSLVDSSKGIMVSTIGLNTYAKLQGLKSIIQ